MILLVGYYQRDGNLVLCRPGWGGCQVDRDRRNNALGFAVMQGDGNFVVYHGNSHRAWNSGTAGHRGAYLIVRPDRNLVVYDNDYNPLWRSNTVGP